MNYLDLLHVVKLNYDEVKNIAVGDEKDFDRLHMLFMDKNNGLINQLNKSFKLLTSDQKKEYGNQFQDLKQEIMDFLDEKHKQILILNSGFPSYVNFDPGLRQSYSLTRLSADRVGKLHPYSIALKQINDLFISMGFEIVDGPVVETEFFNFSALNVPEGHPARDAHDTFWLKNFKDLLLRTHTSGIQVREAMKRNPPIAFIAPGVVYRNEATDASHDFMFWQFEGLYISDDASIANLLFILRDFLQNFFEKNDLQIRTRPSFFPFVEPGMEVDMSCPFCENGCSTCKQSQWIEIAGCGMVHEYVLKNMNIDSVEYRGFAFGFGLTRLVMLKYGISDIRDLHSSIFY